MRSLSSSRVVELEVRVGKIGLWLSALSRKRQEGDIGSGMKALLRKIRRIRRGRFIRLSVSLMKEPPAALDYGRAKCATKISSRATLSESSISRWTGAIWPRKASKT